MELTAVLVMIITDPFWGSSFAIFILTFLPSNDQHIKEFTPF